MDKVSIPLIQLRFLNFSAASGLLRIGDLFYAVADDELNLSSFYEDPDRPEQSIRLFKEAFPHELPPQAKSRKQLKPDSEALLLLPNQEGILVIPSGSKANRILGALIRDNEVATIQFQDLYQKLSLSIPDLNIEGATVINDEIRMFSRGNGPSQTNFIIKLNLATALRDLQKTSRFSAESILGQAAVNLGSLLGHNLSFTDVAVEGDGRIWYLAVAEGGKSTVEDGSYLGAVLGCMNLKNEILFQKSLEASAKPEGLALDTKNRKFYVVTDADDRTQPAQLLQGDLPAI